MGGRFSVVRADGSQWAGDFKTIQITRENGNSTIISSDFKGEIVLGEDMAATNKGKKFWMVCREIGSVKTHDPKQVFSTKKFAMQHAEELARTTGHRYYLLESVDYVEPASPPVKWGRATTDG